MFDIYKDSQKYLHHLNQQLNYYVNII